MTFSDLLSTWKGITTAGAAGLAVVSGGVKAGWWVHAHYDNAPVLVRVADLEHTIEGHKHAHLRQALDLQVRLLELQGRMTEDRIETLETRGTLTARETRWLTLLKRRAEDLREQRKQASLALQTLSDVP